MNKYLRILFFAVLFSFVWGAWWAIYNLEKSEPLYKSGPVIRLLAIHGVFSRRFLEEFQKNNYVQLTITEKDSELEVLREALSKNTEYDLIQINSFISKSFMLENVFVPLENERLPQLQDISVDFKNLDFDPDNKYLAPLSWGLNGFLVNTKQVSLSAETLNEILDLKAKFTFLSSPIELFSLAVKLKPIVKTWVETGQKTELQKDLKEIRARIGVLSGSPLEKIRDGTLQVAQATNGQAAKLIAQDSSYKFILPKERATLWLSLIGVSRGAADLKFTHHVLNQLLDAATNRQLVESNDQASVLNSLNSSDLPDLQKASFIRQVPLSRVDLFINHEALEQTWLEAIRKEWTQFAH